MALFMDGHVEFRFRRQNIGTGVGWLSCHLWDNSQSFVNQDYRAEHKQFVSRTVL